MSTLQRLYTGSFRGAEFYFQSLDTTSGRKTVIHEFPKKDNRYVEDLGRNLRSFTITAQIFGTFGSTIDYESKKKRLRDALNTEGIGLLIHPFYGAINAVPLTFTERDSITEINATTFEMSFVEASPNIYPASTGQNKSLINRIYDSIYNFVKDDLHAEWIISFVRNIDNAATQLNHLYDLFSAISKTITSFGNKKDFFHNDLEEFNRNIYKLPQNSENLSESVTNLFAQFDELANTEQGRFNAGQKIFGFGETDNPIERKTTELVERDNNRKLLNGAINSLALTNMYDSAINLEYKDELDLNQMTALLENNYQRLLDNQTNFLSELLFNAINNIRDEVRLFFENLRITINKISQIETKTIPVTVLAYKYYGDIDNYQEIINLNNIANPLFISGEIRILSA